MNLARPWKINHADAQGQRAHRHHQHYGSEESYEKSQQACAHATSIGVRDDSSPGGTASASRYPCRLGVRLPTNSSSKQSAAPRKRIYDTPEPCPLQFRNKERATSQKLSSRSSPQNLYTLKSCG